ncbi:hypothetical protein, partial [Marinitenerispora sediminis]
MRQAATRGSGEEPSLRVFAIPMRTRFRGVTSREGVLVRGA